MRAPVDVAACGWLLDDADAVPAAAAASATKSLETRPDPGSGDTSHLELPS